MQFCIKVEGLNRSNSANKTGTSYKTYIYELSHNFNTVLYQFIFNAVIGQYN